MTSSNNSWICDGTPKNGREYSGLGGAHEPHENHALDCEICGLPRESSQPGKKGDSGNLLKKVIPLAIVAIAVVGGGAAYTLIMSRCEPGTEKIDGQCIDPFLEPYQEATEQGNKAIIIADNYQALEELEKARTILSDATAQLTQIPTEALIYPEVETTLEEYQQKETEISSNLEQEKAALRTLQEAEAIAETAATRTNTANTASQLEAAKQKWQEAIAKLQKTDDNTLVVSSVQQYQSDYEEQIANIDDRIATIARQNRPRPSVNTNYRTPGPKRSSPPRTRTTAPQPKPQAAPSDPCAVVPKPDYCRF